MGKILLSIHSEYANLILVGDKKYEYRKRLPQKHVDKIIIYSTSLEKKVIGEVEVTAILSIEKTNLWEKTKNYAGISKEKYMKYFSNYNIANAYVLGNVIKFDPPKTLADYGLKTAPQSFIYLN